jgi:hypothetical protein
MGKRRVRIVILCEDRAQQHFFKKLSEQLDHVVLPRIQIAPAGQGSAEQWVRKQYPTEVRAHRQKSAELIGLVVGTDGDRFGVDQRKSDLDQALKGADLPLRQDDERIAICVPTWSIETWFAWLCGLSHVDEATKYKNDTGYNAAQRRQEISPTIAAQRWTEEPKPDEAERVPSLDDGRWEMARLSVER